MPLKNEFSDLRLSFEPLTLYQKFEQVCVLMLTTLIAIIIALALWNLTLKILLSIWATNFDPTDYGVFQTVFGMIFTVIIALEFKRYCTRVQALPAGGGGAARQCCASTLCHPDCVTGGGTQIDHSRSVEHGCLPSAGARRSHPRAGRRLLAGARPRAAARNHRGGRRMRLHCKAVATKADKTSSNSKFLAWREETGCQQTDLHFCCWR